MSDEPHWEEMKQDESQSLPSKQPLCLQTKVAVACAVLFPLWVAVVSIADYMRAGAVLNDYGPGITLLVSVALVGIGIWCAIAGIGRPGTANHVAACVSLIVLLLPILTVIGGCVWLYFHPIRFA